ncbi:MAG TPA: aspartate-semialdehyde dehydrogenase [Erysipelothrix sp.]
MPNLDIAIIGATGLVGTTILEVLENSHLEIHSLTLYASQRSAGKQVSFNGKKYEIIALDQSLAQKSQHDIVLMSAGGNISQEYAPIFVETGAFVIDNSSTWRMSEQVPLVVPEVNPEAITNKTKLIANPNCSTIQSVLALKPIYDLFGIRRIVYNTYQSVSGSGWAGIEDLQNDTALNYPYKIKHNVLPHIDDFLANGYTKEEVKMIEETQKIFANEHLKITATTVRVPLERTHAVAMNVETKKKVNLDLLRRVYQNTSGIILLDDPKNNLYPLAEKAIDTDEVYVGRLREDASVEHGLDLWCVADNIRKGAASNTVQIAELIIEKGLI